VRRAEGRRRRKPTLTFGNDGMEPTNRRASGTCTVPWRHTSEEQAKRERIARTEGAWTTESASNETIRGERSVFFHRAEAARFPRAES